MKSLFIFVPFLFVLNDSLAQTTVADTSGITVRRGSCIYYIDGVKVVGNCSDSTSIEKIMVITGGLPVVYGDINSSIIKVNSTPQTPAIDPKILQKVQKMATK